MENWLPAVFGFGGVLIGSLFSLWLTKLQLNNADKRFERELLQAREDAQRQRRWEIRSEPLIILRTTLAKMATKLHILVTNTQLPRNQSDITEEVESKKSQQALDNWRDYMTSGDFLLTLNLQYDMELIKLIEEIESGYLLLFEYAVNWKDLKTEELKAFREISLNIKNKIPEVQEVIYKRLEEL